ncbi:TPA: DUF3102 domain-containing protein [Salmonella enterica subsp. enterica serovar Montevideo]|uniref:DUF3102 domain-containing protein n=1 Tax=Enterobacteriaceae TaxID=543 RepID=UPI00128A5324|nr:MULTISPECIES: DUF3102 domain-containing protein [Enterobacteriaceae]EAY1844805.1 DUF3102 domain-containing protein [Salmonella enterica]ECE9829557.1 DUF3102 domain-containing protein [Salmonella enterica subsp. enterica serovar Montevideo]EDT4638923.1 DUF3102 domain-containing protein [Salmonella enterica subsp. enterica]MDU4097502.1 DUF3102 domain-containing protein [Enterobacter hormaechei]EED6080849.1 DUF3102 domain-containing protein [Salmonella enterica subsp. enterica serovar Montevid
MGRTKSQPVELVEDASLSDGLNVSLNAMTEHRLEIMQQFGDGLPYERDRIVHETRFYMAQSAEAMLEAGKRLVILKENEPHGDFINILENDLGLEPRVARRMMQASVKFLGNGDQNSKRTALTVLGKTKLYELMVLDDEELDALADGGTVAGATLDDIDRMTSRELKAALREARETNAAQQRVLADKNEKIDSLSTKLEKKSRIQPPKPDEEVKKMRAEVTALAVEAESAIAVRLSSAFETLCAYCAENMIDTPRDFMAGLVCQLESTARSLRSTFDLPDEPTGNAAPSWLTDPTPQINGQEA